jgi:hypothetical protein
MNASFLLFAQATPLSETAPATSSAISIQAALLIIVFGALIFLVNSLAALRARVDELEQRKTLPAVSTAAPQSPPASSSALVPASPAAEAIPTDTLAVIAAAIHVTLQGQARIIAITPQGEDRAWPLEGRRQIFHSHKVR